jgi:hypothetical protein
MTGTMDTLGRSRLCMPCLQEESAARQAAAGPTSYYSSSGTAQPPTATAPTADKHGLDLRIGDQVTLTDFVDHPSFNGTVGTITECLEDGRWCVSLIGESKGYHLRWVKGRCMLRMLPDPP